MNPNIDILLNTTSLLTSLAIQIIHDKVDIYNVNISSDKKY